jgi:nuclear pore complex protein Nup107
MFYDIYYGIIRLAGLRENYVSGLTFLDQEQTHLILERQTWLLMKRLYEYRLNPDVSSDETTAVSLEANYQFENDDYWQEMKQDPTMVFSDLLTVQRILNVDRTLHECLLVKSWLEDIAEPIVPFETRKGYLENTRRALDSKSRKLSKTVKPLGSMEVISSMEGRLDPDSMFEYTSDSVVHPDDQIYENALSKTIFDELRRGRIDQAMEMSRESDEAWRSAILAGSLYYHDAILAGSPGTTIMGNANRSLWKETCYHLSLQESLGLHERAIYAILCGHVAQILPVCESWEDELWAHYSSLIETKLDDYLNRLSLRSNWPLAGVDNSKGKTSTITNPRVVFSKLHVDTDPAHERYHFIQSMLIVGDVEGLIRDMRTYLEASRWSQQDTLVERDLMRLIIHMILVLRYCDVPVPQDDTNTLLGLYIQYLINTEKNICVAFYTSMLPETMQIEAYTAFCLGISGPIESKLAYLRLAQDYGINVERVAYRVIETIYTNKAIADGLPGERNMMMGDEEDEDDAYRELHQHICSSTRLDLESKLGETDLAILHALEWLTYESSWRSLFFYWACAFTRLFLFQQQWHVVTVILELSMHIFSSRIDDESNLNDPYFLEFLDYEKLALCIENYHRWAEWHYAQKPHFVASGVER